jgi:hypothetical protein
MPKTTRFALTAFATTFLLSVSGAGSAHAKSWFWGGTEVPTPEKLDGSTVKIDYTAKTKTTPKTFVKGRVLVKAPVNIVWQTVHEERQCDPDMAYCKLLTRSINEQTYEEKFVLIPVLSSTTCVLKDVEVPNERIDYELVKSDHFKAMDGSWRFTACEAGTMLELISHVDTGLPVPQSFVDNSLARKIERRLTRVKTMAESKNNKIANIRTVE